jgi:NAD/NADP transhydrogenase alpha subunit
VIEAGAGAAAGFSDAAYEAAGVEVVKTAAALWKAATSSPRSARRPRPRPSG